MTRLPALLYGFASYAIGLSSIIYAVGFTSGLVVPKTVDTGEVTAVATAIAIDVVLIVLFAAQHSIMARQGFKSWWTRIVSKSVERSTYVLCSGLALMLLFWQWRPITAVVWSLDNPTVANALTALSLLGWVLAVISTFLINHFELFGLQQVTTNFLGKDMPSARFKTPLFYKVVRHPLYTGLLIAFWATPTMTVGHLLFASLTTAYILIGIMLEERDLIDLFGDDYRRYKARVPKLFPYGTSEAEGVAHEK